jgi:hypothetical protein
MGYNPFIPWSLSPCQICNIHQTLEAPNSNGSGKKDQVVYTGNCARPKALVYMPFQICYYSGFGATLILEGTASANEDKYTIEVYDDNGQLVKSKDFIGQMGKVNLTKALGFSFKPNANYTIKIKLENACFIDEVEKSLSVISCSDVAEVSSAIEALHVFPNPTSDILNIEYDVIRSIDTEIDVIDIRNSQILHHVKLRSMEDLGQKLITTEIPYEIPSGQYALRFITNEGVRIQSFLINR